MTTETVYRSDMRPDFAPFEESCGVVKGFIYTGDLASEVAAGTTTKDQALGLLDDMLAIREVEEMIVRLRSGGGYEPLPGYRSRYGAFLQNSYHWFWDEKMEGVVHADYYEKRGIGAGAQHDGRPER